MSRVAWKMSNIWVQCVLFFIREVLCFTKCMSCSQFSIIILRWVFFSFQVVWQSVRVRMPVSCKLPNLPASSKTLKGGGHVPGFLFMSPKAPCLDATKRACNLFRASELLRFQVVGGILDEPSDSYVLHSYMSLKDVQQALTNDPALSMACIPLRALVERLPVKVVKEMLEPHNISQGPQSQVAAEMRERVKLHKSEGCGACQSYWCLFCPLPSKKRIQVKQLPVTYQKRLPVAGKRFHLNVTDIGTKSSVPFPPESFSKERVVEVVDKFCTATDPLHIEEVGCKVCGMLVPRHKAMLADKAKVNWGILSRPECGITHRACGDAKQPIEEVSGPVLEASCKHVCMACVKLLERNKIPLLSLANGNWLGAVPLELLELSYAEKLLVAQLRPNYCVIRVESGMHRMHANAVLVPNPTSKIYAKLPPHRDDLDDVIAFVFTGPTQWTQKDLRRTPILV